ncbi:ABC transporter ATP-binding protein [Micromonospora sp. DR5-3]|uniref:ABC transporter ATP-binding protein n=1 Tax=unclassified Micromonospora TaxID=2617518 RepID=UPI0011DB7CC2|nr:MULTISPECIES: ABC transporter ATP-binding protein [unclassified Micromonospora]MCW3816621.1 ABC transporter ATP-binding protein [Micromonospora sp. DR5-3]TYC23034.1 ABC transporter ATP-binding protein [Micromonospora sp. MP36]
MTTNTLKPPPPTSTAVAVQARDVVRTYGRGAAAVRALNGATVSIPAGRFTAIMGPSGSGKSTLMHALAGLDTVDAGQILLGGTDLCQLNERQRTLLRRDRVGFVFQSFNLVPTLTARENIVLPLTLAGRRPDPERLAHLVATLGLTDRLRHRPGELSGGQQQRVAVARALITRPEIVFADEPTGNLDSSAAEALLGFLRQAVDDLGQTIVMVTHDPHAAAYADRVVFLADGRIDGELDAPTVPAVLSRMARLAAPATTGAN